MAYQSPYAKKGQGREGDFAENLYRKVLNYYRVGFNETSIEEDCGGVDFRRLNGEEDDTKARKSAGPHRTWLEVCASFQGPIGSGWTYKEGKWVAHLMIYEEDGWITDIIFGRHLSTDAVENIIEKKCDLTQLTRTANELYKLYHRWSRNYKTGDMEHRGATVCVTYPDLEGLPTFQRIPVPREMWPEVMDEYNKLAMIAAKGRKIDPPYKGIK